MKKINIHGVIGLDARSSDIIKQIEDAADEDKVFEIHSPGGSVMEGLAIYNAIRQSRGNSNMRVLGLAASMASIIAMAKGKPEVAKRSIFMIHNAQMYAQGDYQTLQKAADLSNKVSDMMASIYAENSKKSKKSIREMMDAETYMFGEQIKNEGFAKSVYDDKKEEKEEDAVAMAQLEIEECMKKMTGYKEDFAMTAQLIDAFTAEDKTEQNPATNARENNITEVLQMNLKEFLDQNPAAKKEHEDALTASFNAGKKEVHDIVAKAQPFINNAVYPKQVSEMAVAVIKGEKSADVLDTMLASADMFAEMKKSMDAKTEQGKDIPVIDPKTGLSAEYQKTGLINNATDMDAEIKAKRAELGLEV
jgi:ATP-dependent protease ClpP protease subunit